MPTLKAKTLLDAYNQGRADALAETHYCVTHADTALVCSRCEQGRRGATRSAKRAAASRANGAKRWLDRQPFAQIAPEIEENA